MTPAKQKALQALLTNPTRQTAADAAGITVRTLQNYLADDEFQKEYRKAFSNLVNDATRQIQQALNPAISTLRDVVMDKDASTSARIAAARSLLEYGLRMTEFNDILQEWEQLHGEADVL